MYIQQQGFSWIKGLVDDNNNPRHKPLVTMAQRTVAGGCGRYLTPFFPTFPGEKFGDTIDAMLLSMQILGRS